MSVLVGALKVLVEVTAVETRRLGEVPVVDEMADTTRALETVAVAVVVVVVNRIVTEPVVFNV